ncbi:MAG: ChbG/HpnK family deacetylase [Planctomycetia bacterium]|nr:ChbG/HpnK family deacetylase [Planctomycetia bacterium]
MIRWILNADDLGFSPYTNDAIADLAARGKINAASIMPNMPFCRRGIRDVVKATSDFDFGLHLCLTSGRPVAPAERVPLLLDAKGMFRFGFFDLWKHSQNREIMAQIRVEFDAQWKKTSEMLRRYGQRVRHIDSHQHIHAIPALFDLVAEKAQQEKIRVRVPVERFGGLGRLARRFFLWFPRGLMKREILRYCCRNVPQEFRKVGYAGILDTGWMLDGAWREILRTWPPDMPGDWTMEVNFHPATSRKLKKFRRELVCSEKDRIFWSFPNRVREYEAILRLPPLLFQSSGKGPSPP